jgi:ParB-like chromosome segregation protein Spo0J
MSGRSDRIVSRHNERWWRAWFIVHSHLSEEEKSVLLHAEFLKDQEAWFMSKYKYKVHPLAELFPMLPPDEFKKLKTNIEKHGQLEPIWVNKDDVLLDGRNRLKACKELGIPPKIATYMENIGDGEFIWTKNIVRRHLTDDQRAAIGNRWSDTERKAAAERQKAGIKLPSGVSAQRSRKTIAAKARVSEHKVRQVESVAKHKPELLPKIEAGEVTLKDAQKLVTAELTNTKRDVPALHASKQITINLLSTARDALLACADVIDDLADKQADYPRAEKSRSWELFNTAVKRLQDALQTLEVLAVTRKYDQENSSTEAQT